MKFFTGPLTDGWWTVYDSMQQKTEILTTWTPQLDTITTTTKVILCLLDVSK